MNEWLLWQMADSAFPAGSFAHSAGLESAWQHRLVHDAPTLHQFLLDSAAQLRSGVMIFTALSWDDPAGFSAQDRACDLFLNNHVANRASRAQGRAMLASAARALEQPEIVTLSAAARSDAIQAHLGPVFGVICRWCGIDRAQTRSLFLFTALRSTLSAAVRLGIVGPIEGQKLQAQLGRDAVQLLAEPEDGPAPPAQTAPLLDLMQGTQDRLYSRLFQS